jgi:FAD/FMN-containing dehydrogenase
VIDLSNMKGIRVDPVARTARVEGGCTLGDVDHATHPFGLATPTGFMSTTGIGGLTLGGGIGSLARTLGLTIDNLLGVDMVLADGSFVMANGTGDRRHDVLARLHLAGSRGDQRQVRLYHRATSPAIPGAPSPAEDVYHRVVLQRRARAD